MPKRPGFTPIATLPVAPKPHKCNPPYCGPKHDHRVEEGDVWRCECGLIYVAHDGGVYWAGRFKFDAWQWLPATRPEMRQIAAVVPSVIPPGETESVIGGAGTTREPGRLRRWWRSRHTGGDGAP